MSPTEINAVVDRVRAEFIEMPGLRLTMAQAARLWGLDPADWHDVMDALARRAFLRVTATGHVARAEDAA